jgi:hypothetical protein
MPVQQFEASQRRRHRWHQHRQKRPLLVERARQAGLALTFALVLAAALVSGSAAQPFDPSRGMVLHGTVVTMDDHHNVISASSAASPCFPCAGNMPPILVAQISNDVRAITQDSAFRQQMINSGVAPRNGTPEQFATAIAEQCARIAAIHRSTVAKD